MVVYAQKNLKAGQRIYSTSAGDIEEISHATRGTGVSSPALPMRIASNPLESTATLRPGSTFARSATTQNGRGAQNPAA
jgi:hypothetical protein